MAQARSLLNFELRIILVDGQRVHSYDELVRLATSDKYRNREIIEVIILPAVAGG
ncbi:MAG TPA: hypothetical protein VLH15_00420 [Dehalococcoidales bacterium]|nr:hypothetical protein [Dehalococcoidales bacterium]